MARAQAARVNLKTKLDGARSASVTVNSRVASWSHFAGVGAFVMPRSDKLDNAMPLSPTKIYVIHENDAWVEPLRAAFAEIDAPFEEWFLSEGLLDLPQAPPPGVFYNRMSASSHTRDHRYAAELTGG